MSVFLLRFSLAQTRLTCDGRPCAFRVFHRVLPSLLDPGSGLRSRLDLGWRRGARKGRGGGL